MKYKVSDLSGALLDAAVAKALGYEWRIDDETIVYAKRWGDNRAEDAFCPSLYGDHGMPIIARERIVSFKPPHGKATAFIPDRWRVSGGAVPAATWSEYIGGPVTTEYVPGPVEITFETSRVFVGDTPLIAAMRAYCASKFGDEVELP